MKKLLLILGFFLIGFCSCARQPLMTKQAFAGIEPGMSILDVEKLCGKPYNIYSRDANSEIYEYIERILMGPETVQQSRYYLIVSNGKVVGKYAKFSSPPAFEAIYQSDPYPNY